MCAACARSSGRWKGRATPGRGGAGLLRRGAERHHRRWPPPLAAAGLKLKARLEKIADSLERVAEKGAPRRRSRACRADHRRSERTAALWPDIERAYAWVHKAAHILNNHEAGRGATGPAPLRRVGGCHGPPSRQRRQSDRCDRALRQGHPQLSRGLFHCYVVPDLPRTNNDLEHLFGSQRYHERRASGRKTASPAIVLRGEVRLIAAVATRLHPPARAIWAGQPSGGGTNSANGSNRDAKPASCAPASAAIRMPIWQNWNRKSAS